MSDPYLDALRLYEAEVVPAYEAIRQARQRLWAALGKVHVTPDERYLDAFLGRSTEPDDRAIEQPGRVEASAPLGSPAPADEAVDGEAPLSTSSLASPNEQPGPAEVILPPSSKPARAPKPPAENRKTCNRCGREDFRSAAARGNHEKHCTGAGTQRIRPPVSELYLCDRCDAPFGSRELMRVHLETCSVVRATTTVEPDPDVVLPLLERPGVRPNPRSVLPLELRPRHDQVVGE